MTPECRKNMGRVLNPRHILFMGSARFVTPAIEACQASDFEGEIFAVSSSRDEIAGVPCVRTVSDLPKAPDAAFLGIPADATIEVVGELNAMGAGGAACFASGFSEFGEIGKAREAALVEAAGDMAIVGPNCFGVVNYVNHGSMWPVGVVHKGSTGAAVVAQSGNVCINLTMNQRHVPFSYIISIGNQAILAFEDYIDFLVDDPHVTAIGLFMEGIQDVGRFSEACVRAAEKDVPIIAFRVGVSELGAELAATHTSSLAGQNELYEALFDRLGIMQVQTVPQFQELLKMASLGQRRKGNRLAVFSSSGGDNGMAADFTSGVGLELSPLSNKQRDVLKDYFPDFIHVGNPLDFTSQYWGDEEGLYEIVRAGLSEGFDQALLLVDHPLMELGDEQKQALANMVSGMGRACGDSDVPGVVASVVPESIPDIMRQQCIDLDMVPLQGIHDAGPVLGKWTSWCLRDRSRPIVPPLSVGPKANETIRTLDEATAKERLSAAGIPVPRSTSGTADEVVAAAGSMNSPMVLKALHADLAHKTEAGGVALNLETPEDVAHAAGRIKESVATYSSDLVIDRYLLEEMAPTPLTELLVGIQRDPHFGFVMVIAAGGILVELIGDAARLLLPAREDDIHEALRSLKAFPLLDGFRGRPKADIDAIVNAIAAIGDYAMENQDTLEGLDINPLMVYAAGSENSPGVIAVDALIVESSE